MAGCIWGAANAVTYAGLTAGSAQPGRAVTNLATPIGAPAAAWQTVSGALTADAGAWFTMDALSDAQRWRAFALSCTNLTPLAVVRFRVGPAAAIIPEVPAVNLQFDPAFATPGPGTWTWARATPSWCRQSNGIWTEVGPNLPAIHHAPETMECLGALLLRAVTNEIRNSRMEGGAAGTPGTLPTNCSVAGGGGLSTQVVLGSVTEDGLSGFDFRVFGTASGPATLTLWLEAALTIAAATGNTVGQAIHLRQVQGDLTNISELRIGHFETTSGGSALVPNYRSLLPDSTRLGEQRYENPATLSGGVTTAFVRPYLQFIIAGAGAVDLTLRIAAPLLHQGLGSWICPVPVTPPVAAPGAFARNADNAAFTPSSPLMTEGAMTLYLRAALLTSTGSLSAGIQIDDGSNNNRIAFRPVIAAGVPGSDILGTAATVNVIDTPTLNTAAAVSRLARHVVALGPGFGFKRWNDDLAFQTDPDLVSGLTTVRLNATAHGTAIALRELRVYPKRLSDAQCAQLVTDGTTLDPGATAFDSGFVGDLVRAPAQKAIVVAPADAIGRYARCDIYDPTNPDGFLSIGLAYAGPVWWPQVGASFESVFAPESAQDAAETRGGQQHIRPLWRRLAWDVLMEHVIEQDLRAYLHDLEIMAAAGANILFIPDPSDPASVKRDSIFGLLEATAPVAFAGRSTEARTWRARITDRL